MTKATLLLLAATLITSCSQDKVKDSPAVEKEVEKVAKDSIVTAVEASDILIDVRSPQEFAGGHLKGSVNIPHTSVAEKIAVHEKNKDAKIVVYCRSGGRAGMAEKALRNAGYTNVLNAGGFKDLVEKGLPAAEVE